MNYKEFGDKNNDVIMLLHGGGLSWWNYKEEAELLKKNYHVIVPILDGHSESDRNFISIEDNAQEIIDYIDENYNGHIKMISGLSLGGQTLLEMLARRSNICDYAIIESALVIPMKLINKMISPAIKMSYWLISKKWFSKIQFNYLRIKKDLFEDYYKDTCKINKNNMIAFTRASVNYEIKNNIANTKTKVMVIAGKRESRRIKDSGRIIHQYIENSIIKIIPKYYHGDLSINNPNYYLKLMEEFIGKNEIK